jgi:type I restriction enzyme S subunit
VDWNAPLLEEVSSLITNGFVGTATPHYTNSSGVRYLYGTNVQENRIDLTDLRYVTKAFDSQEAKTRLKEGDLLTVQSGHIGTTAVVPQELEGANCHALIVTRLHRDKANPAFLSQYLNSHIGRARQRGLEVGSTILHINTKDLKRFRIPLPPLAEQEKIAAILSMWDRAIELTKKMIAVKQKHKAALMQQLLTGSVCFHEFQSGEPWKTVALGDLFTERKETGFPHLPLLSVTAGEGIVHRDTLEKKDSSNADKSAYLRICPGDIGYNTMRMWQGVSALSEYEGIVSPAYTVCIPKKHTNAFFMSHLFKFPPMVHRFWRYSQGLVDDTLNLKFSSFRKIKVSLPPTLDEQKAIGAVLTAQDREISLLQQKLDALRKQKKGLMQQLLTGKVRVKTPVEPPGE